MKALKLPENPTPEQFEKLKKPIMKYIIEGFYLDGVDDLTVKIPGDNGSVASGKFLDRRIGQANRVFSYVLEEKDGEYTLDYRPLSGDFSEGGPDDEDKILYSIRTGQPVELEFNEGEPLPDDFWETYDQQQQEALYNELVSAGLGDLVQFEDAKPEQEPEEDEPDWAKV